MKQKNGFEIGGKWNVVVYERTKLFNFDSKKEAQAFAKEVKGLGYAFIVAGGIEIMGK